MAWSSVCSLSAASRYMTCSTGASKPVSSMSQTTRMDSGSLGSLKRSINRSCCSLLRCQRARRSSSLWPDDMMKGRLGAVQTIQRLLVSDSGVTARGHHLGLEAVRGDELREVLDEVQADRFDAARRAGDRRLGGEPLFDRCPFVVGPVGEHVVEHLVDGLPDDLECRAAGSRRRSAPSPCHGPPARWCRCRCRDRRPGGCCGPSCRSACR